MVITRRIKAMVWPSVNGYHATERRHGMIVCGGHHAKNTRHGMIVRERLSCKLLFAWLCQVCDDHRLMKQGDEKSSRFHLALLEMEHSLTCFRWLDTLECFSTGPWSRRNAARWNHYWNLISHLMHSSYPSSWILYKWKRKQISLCMCWECSIALQLRWGCCVK